MARPFGAALYLHLTVPTEPASPSRPIRVTIARAGDGPCPTHSAA